MAVKWAVANGNWSAGATWNGGVVPAIGDEVYLNGHNVTLNIATITCKSISNTSNDDYSIIGGGSIVGQPLVNTTINANIIQHNSLIINQSTYQNAPYYFTINGNITADSDAIYISGNTCYFSINGNIASTNGSVVQINCGRTNGAVQQQQMLVNGNVSCVNLLKLTAIGASGGNLGCMSIILNGRNVMEDVLIMQSYSGQTIRYHNFVCSGSLTLSGLNNDQFSDATIIGDLFVENKLLLCDSLTINGSITYKSTNNTMGVRYTTMNILNPDTFTWKDISEPRSNPFIIVTDADMNNRQQYPSENEVKEGTEYIWGEKVGTYQQPPESVVLDGYIYDNGDKIGTLENENIVGCVTPEDVRKDVPLVGMGVVGSLVVPSVDDVREGVVFDNGSVGTLIVEGGGERLRIADFGYYTRSTSITYIVDLTESDKPAFADCEKIVLLSLFPTLDLDNIPDKFFDDLFVQFLRYRLLVEYYRGISVNSKFTPSEPTTEIVNYANTKCEYWLNTANLFLQLWGEKYPNSVKRDRILL